MKRDKQILEMLKQDMDKRDIPDFWDIKSNYEIGDSIIKKKGEKNVKLVKPDTTIILRLGGKDGSLSPEEQDSIYRELTKKK